MADPIEEWRDVPGFEGKYQVSDLGRVRSVEHRVRLVTRQAGETTRRVPSKILTPGTYLDGHKYVFLGRGNRRAVHRLVLEAFVGPCPEGEESLHENHTPSDNKLSNLKWGTRSENLKMDYARGLNRFKGGYSALC